jgi:pimeloyl-ACP methyl ester carboxylesterase
MNSVGADPIAHTRIGAGTPLVLIHGLGARRELWEAVVPALAARHEVVLVDLPGFGESLPLPGPRPPSPVALADALADFFSRQGMERPHVAGNSLGGWVALELARRGAARSTAAISPAGFGNDRETAFMRVSLVLARRSVRALRPVLPFLTAHPFGRAALGAQFFARPWRVPGELTLRTLRGFGECPGFHPTLREMVAARFTGGEEIDVPVTIVWGDRDRLLLPRQAPRAVRAIPGARLVELPGCGHCPFWDDPAAVARALLDGAAP